MCVIVYASTSTLNLFDLALVGMDLRCNVERSDTTSTQYNN
jgi:hypothetical protein